MFGRCLSFVACVTLLTSGACKSKGGDSGGGATAGTTAGSDGARLVLGGSGDASKITVTVLPTSPLPVAIERFTLAIQRHFKLVALVELGPESPTPVSGQLAIPIDPAALPPNVTVAQLRAVGVGKNVAPEDLSLEASGNKVTISTQHVAHVLVLAPLPDATLLGTPARILTGTMRVMSQDACHEWITPESPGIAAIAKDPAKLSVAADGTITLEPKLKAMPVDAEGELSKPDDVLRRGGGDSANTSVVFASLFLARGEIVGLASAFVTYVKDGQTQRGVWQWATVVHEGKPYFVDAFDPSAPRLVPIAEATERYQLSTGRFCSRAPDGAPVDRSVWQSVPATKPN